MIGRIACAALVLFFLAGCSRPAVIADIEEDKVIVQQGLLTSMEAVMAEAERGCALHGRRAQPISTRPTPNYVTLHLFACVK